MSVTSYDQSQAQYCYVHVESALQTWWEYKKVWIVCMYIELNTFLQATGNKFSSQLYALKRWSTNIIFSNRSSNENNSWWLIIVRLYIYIYIYMVDRQLLIFVTWSIMKHEEIYLMILLYNAFAICFALQLSMPYALGPWKITGSPSTEILVECHRIKECNRLWN